MFLDYRPKRVNDGIWNDLTLEFVKQKRSYKKLETSHEECLIELLSQITQLADMQTGPGSDVVIMTKTISSVRDVDAILHICRKPPGEFPSLNSVHLSCDLEAERMFIRSANSDKG